MSPATPPTFADPLREHLDARFHGPLMAFFLRRIRDRAQAEDLTQEVLLRVIQAARRSAIEQPESFVFKVANNLLHDRKREQLRAGNPLFVPIDEAVAQELERELVEERSPERVFLSKGTLDEVLRVVGELGDRTRNIFVLFKLENMKQKDIAALYGIAQSTVEKNIMRAIIHLEERYGHR